MINIPRIILNRSLLNCTTVRWRHMCVHQLFQIIVFLIKLIQILRLISRVDCAQRLANRFVTPKEDWRLNGIKIFNGVIFKLFYRQAGLSVCPSCVCHMCVQSRRPRVVVRNYTNSSTRYWFSKYYLSRLSSLFLSAPTLVAITAVCYPMHHYKVFT